MTEVQDAKTTNDNIDTSNAVANAEQAPNTATAGDEIGVSETVEHAETETETAPTTEVAIQDDNLPEAIKFDDTVAGAIVDSADIIIPKIWLMQQMSTAVIEGVARAGEYRNSVENQVLGYKETKIDLVIFDTYKTWQVFEEVADAKGKMESVYKETLAYYGNEHLKFDDVNSEGVKVHRDMVIGFVCLLATDVAEGVGFPYFVDFKRTSRDAGKLISSWFTKMRMKKIPSYGKIISITSKLETFPNNKSAYVKKTTLGRDSTQREVVEAENWFKTLEKATKTGAVRVDDGDLKGEPVKVGESEEY